MGLFKKLARGAKRIVRKNKGGFGRLAKKVGPGLVLSAVAPVAAPLIVKAASVAKTLGKKTRGLETPKSLVPIIKAAEVRVKKTRSKLPGGAPMPSMPTIGTPSVGMMASRAVGAQKSLYKKAAKKPKANGKSEYYTRGKNKGKKRRVITAPPSAKQLEQRARFAAMRKKKAA